MRIGQTLWRGFAAAHGALLGALYLFLLHAPIQVLSAVAQGITPSPGSAPDQEPGAGQLALMAGVSCGTFVFGLAVFFLFPLVLGGILGQVRDRLEWPGQTPGAFGKYGHAFYSRLLGNQALMTLLMFVLLLPVMTYAMWLAMQVTALGTSPDYRQMTGFFLSSPALLACMLVVCLLASAVGIVYWVASCIVVSERERVFASWRKSLRFCRDHFGAVLALWLVNLVAGLVMSPFALVGSLRFITHLWVLVPLAVVYAALIAYWGVVLAGMVMSLCLAGRPPAERVEAEEPVVAAP
jgi:hypothetical protein